MPANALIPSLLVALVGMYYLVNASAGTTPVGAAARRIDRLRTRLRRTNGLVLVATGVILYLAISRTFPLPPAGRGVGLLAPLAWLATLPLVLAMVVLALLDVRLTRAQRKDDLRRTTIELAKKEAAENAERERDVAEARRWAEQADRAAGKSSQAVAAVALLAGAMLAGAGCERTVTTAPTMTTAPAASQPATRPITQPVDPEPGRDPQAQNLPRVAMRANGHLLGVQVADDEAKRETGLMFRKHLGEDEGMLFVFPDSQRRGFWMRNTFVPLDIVYLDADRRVINVAQMLPRDERSVYSAAPARYALELPVDAARRLGIKPGMVLELPPDVSAGG